METGAPFAHRLHIQKSIAVAALNFIEASICIEFRKSGFLLANKVIAVKLICLVEVNSELFL